MSAARKLVEPIYVGEISGRPLHFFRPVGDTPDFPWHDHDELMAALGLNRDQRRQVQQQLRNGPFKGAGRTVATTSGITVISPHSAAQGFLGAVYGEDSAMYGAYIEQAMKAAEVLTEDMTEKGRLDFMLSAASGKDISARLDRI